MNSNTRTTEVERAAREQAMFGCTVADLRSVRMDRLEVDGPSRGRAATDASVALSILSDAQAALELGHADTARQLMNRSKWFLSMIGGQDDRDEDGDYVGRGRGDREDFHADG